MLSRKERLQGTWYYYRLQLRNRLWVIPLAKFRSFLLRRFGIYWRM